MAGRVQEAIMKLTGSQPSSPVKEPVAKKGKSEHVEEGQQALAEYLKRELGDMIDEQICTKIKKVDEKLQTIALATDEGFQQLQDEIKKEKNERLQFQSSIEERMKASEFMDPAPEIQASDPSLRKKIDDIEALIKNDSGERLTVVIGGLGQTGTLEEAAAWLDKQMMERGVKMPVTTYTKYEGTFNELMWAQMPNMDAMNSIIAVFQQKNII